MGNARQEEMSDSTVVRDEQMASSAEGWRRRDLGRAVLSCVSLSAAGPACAADRRALRVLAWPGYADADLVRSFEQQQDARVELTLVDTDQALWHHMQAGPGANFDVVAVNTAELQRYIQLGAVQPLDLGALPARARQLARFQALKGIPGLVHDDKSYAIPYAWSEMGLIYHPDHFATPPTSIAALWDPRLQGRVLAYDGGTHAFSLAAQKLGLPSPFRIPDAQWPRLVESLVALRRNVSGFYTLPEESLDLYRRRGGWLMLANYGRQQFQLLRQAGLDVRYALPREGALAWLDCWAISRHALNPALAHAWINHLLSAPASAALRQRQGLGATTADGDAPADTAPLVWLQPVENDERRNRLWRRIVSGDSAAKVLRS